MAIPHLLLHFERQSALFDGERVIYARHGVPRELDIHNGADDFYDVALRFHGRGELRVI